MPKEVLSGSCLCGAVRYELTGAPSWAHDCYCSRCRKVTGTGFAANLFVPLGAFSFVKGEQHVRSFKPPDAERFTHAFCERCGASLPTSNEANGLMVVPMGSLDDDPGCSPQAHIWVGSKAPWVTIEDALPQHPEALGSKDD
mgnify:CR=1 FL=1